MNRLFLACSALLLSMPSLSLAANSSAGKYLLYVGTYTTGESKGIYAYRYDEASGKTESLGLAAASVNPSFLAADPSGRFLYAVNETGDYHGASSGAISAFAVDRQTGKLTLLNELASRGADPCYISLDKTGKYLLVANYTGGNIAVFPVAKDGKLERVSAFVQHTGSSVNPQRQEAAHAHWIETTADNRFVIVADLGLDKLMVYRFEPKNSFSLTPSDPPFTTIEPGSGPRHVAFRPDNKFAYVISELASTVTVLSYDSTKGVLTPVQTISTLPEDFSSHNDAAEIHVHPNGKFLYASNRGEDSIVVYSIDQKSGRLSLIEDVPTQGKTPRNFEIDPSGSRLLVANQESGNIVVFNLDTKTGHLSATGETLNVASPVSLRFVPAE